MQEGKVFEDMLLYQAKKSLADKVSSGSFTLRELALPGVKRRGRGEDDPHDNVTKLSFEAADGMKLNVSIHGCEIASAADSNGNTVADGFELKGAKLTGITVCGFRDGIWGRPTVFATGVELEATGDGGGKVAVSMKGGRA